MFVDTGSAFGDLERASFDRINAHPIPIVRTSKVVRRCMHVHTYIQKKKSILLPLAGIRSYVRYITLHTSFLYSESVKFFQRSGRKHEKQHAYMSFTIKLVVKVFINLKLVD